MNNLTKHTWAWFLAILLLIIGCLILTGCQDDQPRQDPPPAAAAAADLHDQADAAGIAAAKATAKGDQPEADYQGKLRAELLRLAGEADQRAIAEQRQIDSNLVKTQAAADARSDRRIALLVTAGGSILSVLLLIACLRLGMSLWIPGCSVGVTMLVAGIYASSATITTLLGWAAIAAVAITLGVLAWWMVRRLVLANRETAAHGDRVETGILTALAGLDDSVRSRVLPLVQQAITTAKGASFASQIAQGVHRQIQTLRGKR